MIYRNKKNGMLYDLTNKPDESGICQVLDLETNQLALMRFEELECPFVRTDEFMKEMKAFYTVSGLSDSSNAL